MHLPSFPKFYYIGVFSLCYAAFGWFNFLSSYLLSLSNGEDTWEFWIYFTNHSNAIALIFLTLAGVALLAPETKLIGFKRIILHPRTPYILASFMLLVFIMISCVLVPFYSSEFISLNEELSIMARGITPFVIVMLFFIGNWNGKLKYIDLIYFIIYPLLYVGISLFHNSKDIEASGVSFTQYGFLNPTATTWESVTLFIVALILLFLIIGFVLIFLYNKSRKLLIRNTN